MPMLQRGCGAPARGARDVRVKSGDGLFTPEFAAALAGALQRNGNSYLTESSKPEEP
jgi:hypothetical protein